MRLLGPVHLLLLAAVTIAAVSFPYLVRRRLIPGRLLRLALGYSLAINEVIWWIFRYSHEGFRFPSNLPLQLCDITVWTTVLACLTLNPLLVEFSYFAGLSGAGIAVLTPDLWSPWASYPAIYFFLAHGGIIVAIAVLVFGGIVSIRPGAVLRVFCLLILYVALLSVVNAAFGTNYMYLCRKPKGESLLDVLGRWPIYLIAGAMLALALFQLLWLAARPKAPSPEG